MDKDKTSGAGGVMIPVTKITGAGIGSSGSSRFLGVGKMSISMAITADWPQMDLGDLYFASPAKEEFDTLWKEHREFDDAGRYRGFPSQHRPNDPTWADAHRRLSEKQARWLLGIMTRAVNTEIVRLGYIPPDDEITTNGDLIKTDTHDLEQLGVIRQQLLDGTLIVTPLVIANISARLYLLYPGDSDVFDFSDLIIRHDCIYKGLRILHGAILAHFPLLPTLDAEVITTPAEAIMYLIMLLDEDRLKVIAAG